MYAITGITGKVGSEVARALLSAKRPVRAVLRDAEKGDAWRDRGCSVAIADLHDVAALTAAFSGAEGIFVLLPARRSRLEKRKRGVEIGFEEARCELG